MRKCKWSFDVGPTYRGWTDNTYWNGFLNVWVTPGTRDRIVTSLLASGNADNVATANDMLEIKTVDGKVSLARGYATVEVEDEDEPEPDDERAREAMGLPPLYHDDSPSLDTSFHDHEMDVD